MIYGVVGRLHQLTTSHSPIATNDDITAGNGKTGTLVFYGREEAMSDREVISNFHTTFSQYMTSQEILDGFFDREGVFYLLTEVQKFLNSVGNPTQIKSWVEGLISQRRKLHVDIMWDSQRIMSVDNRFREHTSRYYVPRKHHFDDGSYCNEEDCKRHHYVKIYLEQPFEIEPVAIFDCEEIGRLYNTDEIIRETINAPGRSK